MFCVGARLFIPSRGRALRLSGAGSALRAPEKSWYNFYVTPEENRALNALEKCSMRMASSGKRFRNDLIYFRSRDPQYRLTKKQASYLWLLVDMYRRQIPDVQLIGWGSYRKITGEIHPDIWLEEEHRPPIEKKKKQPTSFPSPIQTTPEIPPQAAVPQQQALALQ